MKPERQGNKSFWNLFSLPENGKNLELHAKQELYSNFCSKPDTPSATFLIFRALLGVHKLKVRSFCRFVAPQTFKKDGFVLLWRNEMGQA
jgi:hypothetical protein